MSIFSAISVARKAVRLQKIQRQASRFEEVSNINKAKAATVVGVTAAVASSGVINEKVEQIKFSDKALELIPDSKDDLVVNTERLDRFGQLWSLAYQGTNNSAKRENFNFHVRKLAGNAPEEEKLRELSDLAGRAFGPDVQISPSEMSLLLYATALHESKGGLVDEQAGGGPAKGWWQVEPETARDILKNSSSLIGNLAQANLLDRVNLTKEELQAMSKSEFAKALKIPEVNVVFAAAKYVQTVQANNKGQRSALNEALGVDATAVGP